MAPEEDLLLEALGRPRDELIARGGCAVGEEGGAYLDYAGCPPVSTVLLDAVHDALSNAGFGNPHSHGRTSSSTVAAMQEARAATLKYFGLSDEQYTVIFTSGATGSMKLLAETFPWSSRSQLSYTKNAHNSLMGMRCMAPRFNALPTQAFFEDSTVEGREVDVDQNVIRNEELIEMLEFRERKGETPRAFSLLATPGECNFSGAVLNLNRTTAFLRSLAASHRSQWLWLVDAARLHTPASIGALPPAQRPDFVALSYYKIFGYPTGLGALLVKSDRLELLQKHYFGGGTLLAGAADSAFLVQRPARSADHFQDGTPNFHAMVAVPLGFAFIEKLGGIDRVNDHNHRLLSRLLQGMVGLRHSNGTALCTIYSSCALPALSSVRQGPIIAFNLRWSSGQPVGFQLVQRLAGERGLQLRAGCFCNLGGCQDALGLTAQDQQRFYALGRTCAGGEELDVINNRDTGACRVSIGYATTRRDCDVFVRFLEETFLNQAAPASLLPPPPIHNDDWSAIPDSELFWQQSAVTFPCEMGQTALMPTPTGSSADAAPGPGPVLQALYVYPIKSCAGIRVDDWPFTRQGLLFDRWFAVVSASSGAVLTQKQCPRLALVTPSLLFLRDEGGETTAGRWVLQVAATGWPSVLQVPMPLQGSAAPCASSEEVSMNICGRCALGRHVSTDAAQWFTDFVHGEAHGAKKPFILVRTEGLEGGQHGVTAAPSFANTAQYLLLSAQSVRALVQMMRAEQEEQGADPSWRRTRVENFRPNIVIDHPQGQPHDEDRLDRLVLPAAVPSSGALVAAPAQLQATGPCARCLMVNVSSDSGRADCKVLEALRTYRLADRNIYFGQFLELRGDEADAVWTAAAAADVCTLPRLHVGARLQVTHTK